MTQTPAPTPQMHTKMGLTHLSKSPRLQAEDGCLQMYGSKSGPCRLRRCTYHLWSNTMLTEQIPLPDGGKCNVFWRLAKLANGIYEALSDGRLYYIIVQDGEVGQYAGHDEALAALAALSKRALSTN